MTTSFLKIQLADYEPIISALHNPDFSQLLSEHPQLREDDFRVLAHLQPFFPMMSRIGARLPFPIINSSDMNTFAMYGALFDNNTLPEMPANPPTIACFTNHYLRRFVVLSFATEHPNLENTIMNSSNEELEAILEDITGDGVGEDLRVVERPASLKILRCTPEDMSGLPLPDPREPLRVASESPIRIGGDSPIRIGEDDNRGFDAFEAVKSRLVNQNEFLNGSGYSPAEYVPNGDYIQMWSDVVLSPNPNFGDAYTPPVCTPTSIEFLPRVVATPTKNKVTLRVSIEVDGRHHFRDFETGNAYRDISFTLDDWNSEENTPQGIVDEIFLYSGIDLMRQKDARTWFTYNPYTTDRPDNVPVTISGRERGVPSTPYEKYSDVNCVMTFMLIDNLEPNQIDFTREQWGHEVKIYSCSAFINMAQ